MRRWTVFSCLIGLVLAGQTSACGYGGPTPLERFVLSDAVVIGKVAAVEERPLLMLAHAKAGQKTSYKVAVVAIAETLRGERGLTHLRLALPPHQTLEPGFQGVFTLSEHFEEPVYLLQTRFDYVLGADENGGMAQQVRQYRQWSKALKDAKAGLTATDAGERFLTAALLLTQYRGGSGVFRPSSTAKTVKIGAEESKLILQVLADADWAKAGPDFMSSPAALFGSLGLTEQDGWKREAYQDNDAFVKAAKSWLKEHGSRYRITAFVRS